MDRKLFDRRLLEAIRARVAEAEEAGISPEKVGTEETFPVTITHARPLEVRATRPNPDGREDPAVREKERKDVLRRLEQQSADHLQRIVAALNEIGAREYEILPLSNSIRVDLTPHQLQRLDENRDLIEEIDRIRLVRTDEVTCLNLSTQVIEARPFVWNTLGSTGEGVRVAVLDSGVDKNHTALAGRVIAEISTSGESVNIPGSHGTHVAGIIASQDSTRKGVSPRANIINVKVLTAGGFGNHVNVETGMQQAYLLGADVVNMSLGWSHIFHGWDCEDGRCSLCRAAQQLVDLGVVVVVAAGNENDGASGNPAADTSLRCPGQCRGVITVGAVNNDKELASFSSVGPPSYHEPWTKVYHFPFSWSFTIPFPGEPWWTKPDVCAPGVSINSTVLNNGWGIMSGTSMASPHVAGVAALILQDHPTLPPQTVKNLIKHSSESLKDKYSRFQAGDGVVNAYTAVQHA